MSPCFYISDLMYLCPVQKIMTLLKAAMIRRVILHILCSLLWPFIGILGDYTTKHPHFVVETPYFVVETPQNEVNCGEIITWYIVWWLHHKTHPFCGGNGLFCGGITAWSIMVSTQNITMIYHAMSWPMLESASTSTSKVVVGQSWPDRVCVPEKTSHTI